MQCEDGVPVLRGVPVSRGLPVSRFWCSEDGVSVSRFWCSVRMVCLCRGSGAV